MTPLTLRCAARSDVGRRTNNEDACFASPRLAVVADGVGGAQAGEVASRTVVNALIALDKRTTDQDLTQAVAEGNAAIAFVAERRPEYRGMSTTLAAVTVVSDCYEVANVGDSRVYLLRAGELTQLTRDESLVQELIDAGHLTDAEARRHPQRNFVLRALDGSPGTDPAITTVPARPGDRLLVCSDGLSDVLPDDRIAAVLTTRADRRAAADLLVEQALQAGARDNVTVVVADVEHS